ncbi:MAG: Putative isochorismate synthase MenF [Owenweeksia sp. TMED14]|nr:MAG: Putative isochorismate synthase MenF [Owenweeksia sp. TMED14]|tara:strand:- start:2429 stop:3400 length:972 start_codon:yes stop_codon:yes gene_type:complete
MSFAWIREPGKSSEVFSLNDNSSGDFYFSPFEGEIKRLSITERIRANCADWVLTKLSFKDLPNINPQDSHNEESYLKIVSKAVQSCLNGALEKVVLSRRKAHIDISVSPISVFERMCDEYPLATIYLISITGNSLWMGATPECLLELTGNKLKTMSLAATRPTGSEGSWGIKEQEEQHLVTRDIVHMLDAIGCESITVEGPDILSAGPVEHLCSIIRGKHLNDPPITIAKSLHPTPAVGGLPRAQSKAFIGQNEGYDRSFYSGYFGWESNMRSIFYVNLRCMEIGRDGILCYAGGGITSKSNSNEEWIETEEKLKTLERVILG